MERRILLMFSANIEAFCRFGLSLNPCCFGIVTQLSCNDTIANKPLKLKQD